jgi:hypothetical protein
MKKRNDRTGRPNERLSRVDVSQREPVASDQPTEDIEQQVTDMPEAVLDVVAEDPQKQHVAEQVQPAAV